MKNLLFLLGGYAVGRYLEAQAQGVTLEQAFNLGTILTPVANLPKPVPLTPQQGAVASVDTPLSTFFGIQIPGLAGYPQ